MGLSFLTIIRLVISILLPVFASVILYTLERKSNFGKIKNSFKQIIIGITFGFIAICATEFGVPFDGGVINVRSASPLSAGLIFGWPAGLIAGFIGGLQRYLSPTAGDFTRIACTLGTIIAGFVAAIVRRFMLDNRKSSWFYGLLIGLVTEVLHMLMVFLNNGGDIQRAFRVVELCAIPMILSNGISVMLSILFVTIIANRNDILFFESGKKNISQTFQFWLFVCVVLAFTATSFFTNSFQKNMAISIADFTIKSHLTDIKEDIKSAADRELVKLSYEISEEIKNDYSSENFSKIINKYDLAEINFINNEGIVVQSAEKDFIGFDMKAQEETKAFLILLNDKKEFVQERREFKNEISFSQKYVGIAVNDGILQIGFNDEQFQKLVDESIIHVAKYRHVGQKGSIIICNQKGFIVSDNKGYLGQHISIFGNDNNLKTKADEYFFASFYNEKSLCMYTLFEGYYILAIMTEDEAFFNRNASVYMLAFMEVIVFAILFAAIFILIKKLVVQNIRKINHSLSQITDGNLDIIIDVRDNEEFASLSDDINSTVTTLKHYIEEAAARFDKDLEIAKKIQKSALPSVFPPYPNRKDFSIFASMNAAKEVGGDFYDFYLIDDSHLAFLIADVSGKGIPGAMFMMTSKTLIKSHAESGLPVNEIFTQVNEELYKNNEASMFVTAWMGIIDLKTGIIKFANAGHNPPLVKHKNGNFEYLKTKSNFVLAGLEGVIYRELEYKLEKGDKIYLYTDGITEAHNKDNELYGEKRLLDCLNSIQDESVEDICIKIKNDVDSFVGETEQFDDITMLCVSLNDIESDKYFKIKPSIETINQVTEYFESELNKFEVPSKIIMKLLVAVDEIYSNIIRYSNANETVIKISKNENELNFEFIDDGIPYNPLEAKEPDVTASADEREIGGLGIFMVKKILDKIDYSYLEGKNILKLTKIL